MEVNESRMSFPNFSADRMLTMSKETNPSCMQEAGMATEFLSTTELCFAVLLEGFVVASAARQRHASIRVQRAGRHQLTPASVSPPKRGVCVVEVESKI